MACRAADELEIRDTLRTVATCERHARVGSDLLPGVQNLNVRRWQIRTHERRTLRFWRILKRHARTCTYLDSIPAGPVSLRRIANLWQWKPTADPRPGPSYLGFPITA